MWNTSVCFPGKLGGHVHNSVVLWGLVNVYMCLFVAVYMLVFPHGLCVGSRVNNIVEIEQHQKQKGLHVCPYLWIINIKYFSMSPYWGNVTMCYTCTERWFSCPAPIGPAGPMLWSSGQVKAGLTCIDQCVAKGWQLDGSHIRLGWQLWLAAVVGWGGERKRGKSD